MDRSDEIILMQVRLVRLTVKTWNKSMQEVAGLFSAHGVYRFIREMYEEFHVQGDACNLEEICVFLKSKGVAICAKK